jgi:predicted phosphodiesterase
MRLAALSDLHHPESGVDLAGLAAQARAQNVDAVVLVGDAVSQFHPPLLSEVFAALREAAPIRAYVPGNHELWRKEGSAGHVYGRALPALCEAEGWHYLDSGPLVVKDVALVGNIGWYDGSLTDRETFPDFPVALGAMNILKAMKGAPCQTIPLKDVTNAQLAEKSLVVVPPPELAEKGFKPALLRWMDSKWVRLGVTDEEFTADCARRLGEHLAEASNKADRIVVATHMAPFAAALGKPQNPVEALVRAYQGASVLGERILESRKVALCVYGHRHRPGVAQVEHLPVINVTARPDRGGTLVVRDV